MANEAVGTIELKCPSDGKVFYLYSYTIGARLRVGDTFVHDPSEPTYGKCPLCDRMGVITAIPVQSVSESTLPNGIHKRIR